MWYEDAKRFLEELRFVKVTDFAASLKPRPAFGSVIFKLQERNEIEFMDL